MERFSLKTTEERLWALIEERARGGSTEHIAELDRRVWDLFGDTWAVMMTDLSGFSRQVEAFGILHFLQVIFESKRVLEPILVAHDGVLVKAEADSLLVLFRRPRSAVDAALSMMRALEAENVKRTPETKILLCVGIGYGPILRISDHDVFGQQVNAASKLGEDTARAGEILLTREATDGLGPLPEGESLEPLEKEVAGSRENFRLRYRL